MSPTLLDEALNPPGAEEMLPDEHFRRMLMAERTEPPEQDETHEESKTQVNDDTEHVRAQTADLVEKARASIMEGVEQSNEAK